MAFAFIVLAKIHRKDTRMQSIFSFASKLSRLPVEYRGGYVLEGKTCFYVTSEISTFFCLFFLLLLYMPLGAGGGRQEVYFHDPPSIQGKVPRYSYSVT